MVEPKNILIIRVSAIGDVVFSSPLIKALKRTYPNAKLYWLVEPAAASLLKNNADVDVIVWPKQQWKQLWKEKRYGELWRDFQLFRKRLKSYQIDWALDLQGLMKSAVWAWLSGAKRRIGLGSKEGSAKLMTEQVARPADAPRIGSEYLAMAEHLGLDCDSFEMDVVVSNADDSFAKQVVLPKTYAVICPFTTRPQKHWLEERWPELAKQIHQRFGLSVVMLGGPADVEAAAHIAHLNSEIIDMVGQSSLTQTAALIKHASMLVGVDTGLTHMGIAYNIPTVALFGSTCPYTDTTHDNAVVLYHKMECSPCRRNPICKEDFTCMKRIEIGEVMATLENVRR